MEYKTFIFELYGLKPTPKIQVNKYELAIGELVELEHTTDIKIARKISYQHLAEDPEYYTKLGESGLIDEPKALVLYQKYKKSI